MGLAPIKRMDFSMQRDSIYRRFVPAAAPHPVSNQPGYWFAFCQNRLLVQNRDGHLQVPWLNSPDDLHLLPRRVQALGALEGKICFSAELPPESEAPAGLQFSDLRAFYSGSEEDLYLVAGRAFQIVLWDQTHQFCGRCGNPTQYLKDETAKICPVCKYTSYPRISPAVIVAVLKDRQILLTRYAARLSNWHTIIAGFLEPGETLEECVQREVQEEVGLQVKNIRYFGNQPWPFPNNLMIGFVADYAGGDIKVDGVEIASAAWYSATQIPPTPPKMSISGEIIDWFAGKS
jgi:NAD+ diphosphatase